MNEAAVEEPSSGMAESSHKAPSMDLAGMRGTLYDLCCILQSSGPDERAAPLAQLDTILRSAVLVVLADILWLLDLGCDDSAEQRAVLGSLIQTLMERQVVDEDVLRERLEPELLELAGLLPSAQIFNKKIIRINTNMLYKQQKFNLLREESEGFAKLIAVLAYAEDNVLVHDQVVALIDVYAQRIRTGSRVFEELLTKLAFPPSTIANVFGPKLSFLAHERKSEEVMQDMMLAAARLIKIGLMTLEGIYGHLSPSDEDTEKELETILQRIRSGTSAAPPPVVKEGTTKDLVQEHQPTVHDVGVEIGNAVGVVRNQKVLLVAGLLQVGDFKRARIFLDRFPLVVHAPVVASMIALVIHVILEPSLASREACIEGFLNVSNEELAAITPADQGALFESLVGWLRYIKHGLFLDPRLISKICRTASLYLAQGDSGVKEQWLTVIIHHLLPSMTLVQSNPAVSFEIWDIFKKYPYATRFAVYGNWRNEMYAKNSEMTLAKSIVLADIRRVMRRLTRENVRQYGRLIAKLAHSNPVVVFPVILEQLQAYDNLIQPVVDSMKYLTPLDFDVLIFILIDCLAATPGKDRLKDDGTNLSSWLQGLATFAGSLFRRYYSIIDAESLLQYIVNQLRDDNSFDLVVLSELIHRMGGVESVENMANVHVEALAGGPLLLAEVISNQTVSATLRFNKRSSQHLIQVLTQSKLTIPLWILLAQQRTVASFKGDYNHLKLIGGLLDTGQAVFLQYSSLLAQAIRTGQIKSCDLPDLATLTKTHGIDLDLACYMRRTLVRAAGQRDVISDQSLFTLTVPKCPPDLCRLFWFLGISDIHVPVIRYQSELLRLKTILSSASPSTEAEITRWRRDRERAPQTILSLEGELRTQQETVARNIELIGQMKTSLFISEGEGNFFFQCVLPRSIQSPADAMFTARFILLLNKLEICNFSFVNLMDRIVSEMGGVLAMLTEKEAHNFARFFAVLLGEVTCWHSDEKLFQAVRLLGTIEWNMKMGVKKGKTVDTTKSARMDATTSVTASVNENGMDIDETVGDEDRVEIDNVVGDDIGTVGDTGAAEAVEIAETIELDKTTETIETTEPTKTTETTNTANITEMALESMENSSVVSSCVATPTKEFHNLQITATPLSYEDYRHLMFQWHSKLQKSFTAALQSREYLSVRNAVIVLTGIASFFPLVRTLSKALLKCITKLRDEEHREDLKILATRYTAMLTLAEPSWKAEETFHQTNRTETGEIYDPEPKEGRKRKRDVSGEEPSAKRSMMASPKEEVRQERRTSERDSVRSNEPRPLRNEHQSDLRQSDRRRGDRERDRDREIRDRDRERERDRERQRDREREREDRRRRW
ncbi:hypothetical protein PSACC_02740 [Paramicrosporidium saccamoebae]|uniref:THO complex subunit 2 n=1 Tax=Paramicrosporidium saccamoebae TaxID=1246581 RepID=A0A2H9TI66_9FUNG|nr:hypothetical protein PSACC_02740 [Paramicrosporidium saccamoebae]